MGKYKNRSSGRFDQGLPPDVCVLLRAHAREKKVLQPVSTVLCDTNTVCVSPDTNTDIVYRDLEGETIVH